MVRQLTIVMLLAGVSGCSHRIELTSQEGDVELAYSCSSIEGVAVSPSDFDLIEEMAMTAYSHAMGRGRAAEASHLPSLRQERRFSELELAVASYFCDQPSALESRRVPIIRYPISTDSTAPDFHLPELTQDEAERIAESSRVVSLNELRGRPVVLHMLATWCPPCQTEHQDLIEYLPRAPSDVQFVAVVTKDRPGPAIKWLSENGGLPFTTLVDHRDRMANRYGIRGFPQLYVIDAAGQVIYHGRGPTTIDTLDRVLRMISRL